MMEIMDDDEYEAETIRLALAGDAEAGREALLLCRNLLEIGTLSPVLSVYLAARLDDVLEGIKPDRILTPDDVRQALLKALRLAKGPGKPKDPLPDWEMHLGAFAALLVHRGYKRNQIAVAMCDVRADVHEKSLEQSDAYRIGKTWRPMCDMEDEDLLRLIGNYKEILSKYPPLKSVALPKTINPSHPKSSRTKG